MLVSILTALQVILCVALVGLVLIQHGKGADAGAGFGAGASGTVFGASGASNFLSRTTAILATLFFLNCIALSYLIEREARETPAILRSKTQVTAPAPKRSVPVLPSKPLVPPPSGTQPAARSKGAAGAPGGKGGSRAPRVPSS